MNCLSKKWLKLACVWKKEKLKASARQLIEALELLLRRLQKNDKEYKARTGKAESEAFEAKQKVREVIRDE